MKRFERILGAALSLMMALSLCSFAGAEEAKTYTASSMGFGGDVTVTVTVDDAMNITAMTAEGAAETAGIGAAAIDALNGEVLPGFIGRNAAELDPEVDTLCSASITTAAYNRAAKAALNEACGVEETAAAIADGTYTGSAMGFSLVSPVTVTVTVEGGKMTALDYAENGETAAMWTLAVETGNRVLENQSLAVDAVAGATASGNAVKAAIADALVNGAGADANTLYAPVAKTDAVVTYGSEEDPYNVLVVGFGGSGMTAALSAIQHTDKVIAIEMNGKLGGNTSTASGPMGLNPQSKVSTNGGLQFENEEELKIDWLAYTIDSNGEQSANEQIVSDLIDESGETNDWVESLGFTFGNPTSFLTRFVVSQSFQDYALDHVAVTGDFEHAAEIFESLGGEVLLETKATSYIQNAAGDVIGVRAEQPDGTTVEIYAKAVIEATGGFGGSDEMQEKYLGGVYKVYGMQNCDGTMMQAAIDLGADTQNISMPPMSHFTAPYIVITDFDDVAYTKEGYEGTYSPNDIIDAVLINGLGMDVTTEGSRFYPETSVDMEAWQAGSRFYAIVNQGILDGLAENGLATDFTTILGFRSQGTIKAGEPLTMVNEVFEAGIKAGEIIKADTIGELADALGIDAAVLTAQLESYNAACAAGVDNDFGKDPTYLTAMEEGPYYAVIGAPWIYSTVGGLKVDDEMRVIGTDGNVINGLYAVGTDSMGVIMNGEKFYLGYGGVAMGYVFWSGRTAGISASEYAEGFESADVTAQTLETVGASDAMAIPGSARLNEKTNVELVGENAFEITGYAMNNSAAAAACGADAGTGLFAVAAEAAGTGDAAVTCVRLDGTPASYNAAAYVKDGKLVLVQPVTAADIKTAGIIAEVAFADGAAESIRFDIGTLYVDELDDCLTEETGIAGVEVTRTADNAYTVTGASGETALYLPSPAPQTAFVSAVVKSVNGTGDGTEYAEPGTGITCTVAGAGTYEIAVDWNFEVPTLDIWTMTVTNVPYTNSVTYTYTVE